MKSKYSKGERKVQGRNLTQRRYRLWSKSPHCACCGEWTDITVGTNRPFHLDHIIALVNGGADEDHNLQVLCIKCHDEKTQVDVGNKPRVNIGLDGWPI